jgi:hypothetical protein
VGSQRECTRILGLDGFRVERVPTEKSVLVAVVDVAADDGYASGR